MAPWNAARTRICLGEVGDDQLPALDDRAEQRVEVVEFHAARGVLVVEAVRFLVPGDVRDGVALEIGDALGRVQDLADKSVLAFGQGEQVGEHAVEYFMRIALGNEL